MCLLVARLSGSSWLPSSEEFNNAWSANPHGFGVSWKSDQLWINKTLDKESAQNMLRDIPDGSPFIMHWRMATHGSKSVENCHPWSILKGQWVGAHNGILTRQKCIADMTDSQSFMLGLTGTEPNVRGIEMAISRLGYGKMAFLSQLGEVRIANEKEGEWRIKGQVWESNSSMDSRPWRYCGVDDDNESYWPNYYGGSYKPRGSVFQKTTHRWKEVQCEWCNKHAALYKVYEELCCEECIDTVEEVMDKVEGDNK
jgi:hypothetical protein